MFCVVLTLIKVIVIDVLYCSVCDDSVLGPVQSFQVFEWSVVSQYDVTVCGTVTIRCRFLLPLTTWEQILSLLILLMIRGSTNIFSRRKWILLQFSHIDLAMGTLQECSICCTLQRLEMKLQICKWLPDDYFSEGYVVVFLIYSEMYSTQTYGIKLFEKQCSCLCAIHL